MLRNAPSPVVPEALKFAPYRYANLCAPRVHQVILALHSHLEEQLGRPASVAVLARTNAFLGSLSEKIAEDATWGESKLPAVEHELNWDPELAAAAGFVVASMLEWPLRPRDEALERTLSAIIGFYRVKFDSGTVGARRTAQTIENSLVAYRAGKAVRSKTVKLIIDALDQGLELTGDPVRDWQIARSKMTGSSELDEMYKQVRLLRLLKATDALAWELLDAWDGVAGYLNARDAVEAVLAEEALDGGNEDVVATTLMSLHKSKGKEFDGVVIVEGVYSSFLLDQRSTKQEQYAARRLLRVGITRARHLVVFVRPTSAPPLVGGIWL
ncbi:MAG: ATP-binding domain-containing protein [Pseudonocardia sp.]